jgi:tetratricopeptide (TPR) repeat protein
MNKKMKNIQKFNCLILGAILILSSCSESFLEQKDTSNINESSLFLKKADGYSLVTGVYNTFNNGDLSINYMLKGIWFTANFPTQDFHNEGSDTFWNTYEVPTTFDALNSFWVDNYLGISRANAAIPILTTMINKGIFSQQEGNQLIGECYFLRGIYYYYLAVDFGGVPLELEVVKDEGLHPRNTQDEVFASVASDMTKASNFLPWKSDQPLTDRGHATKDAALAYLGDALMWQKKYSEAIPIFDQLDSKCQLEDNFLNIHEIANRNGKESIFEIQFTSYGDMSWDVWGANNQWISSFGMPVAISGFAYAYADKKLYDSFQDGDNRKLCTVIGPGDKHPSPLINIKDYPGLIGFAKKGNGNIPASYYQDSIGNVINTCGTVKNPWLDSDRSGYYGVKFWRNPETCGTKGQAWFLSGDNIMMMRYAQVLLSKAECYYRTGNSTQAMEIVQRIRDRAFGKQVNPSAIVPAPVETDVMKIILDEYHHELAGETSLWFVLRRSGEHKQYVNDKFNITIPIGKDLMPIPQIQIGMNKELVQNPGY